MVPIRVHVNDVVPNCYKTRVLLRKIMYGKLCMNEPIPININRMKPRNNRKMC